VTQKNPAAPDKAPLPEPVPADRDVTRRKFHPAKTDAAFSEAQGPVTPQTQDPAYRLAYRDTEFLLREELRPVRFQLELLKCEMLLEEAGIGSTLVVYGSARIPSPEMADEALATATTPERRAVVERLIAKSRYYDQAHALGRIVGECALVEDGKRQFVICSGGGPSIMEAANRGAVEAGAETIGLNIVLPHEQAPNAFVTPHLSFQFHYFALRKMHFLLRARAVAVFPGGFGTLDEFFELLTLVQTGKMKPMPILLFGADYWSRIVNVPAMVEEGVINAEDITLFTPVETAEEAWKVIVEFYDLDC
jgi:uncharacterized protein (TIGR00730 family)